MIIKYFAWLKSITNVDEEILNDKNIVDIKTLKKFLLKKYPKLDKYIIKEDVIRVAINLEYTTTNKTLNANDEIALFPPVSGG